MTAGARPGERRGGRKKGTPNKAKERLRELSKSLGGDTPQDFLLAVMSNRELDVDVRLEAAKAVAPFVHRRLASVDVTADVKGQYWISDKPMTPEEWAEKWTDEGPEEASVATSAGTANGAC